MISGPPVTGQRLRASEGTWTRHPTSFSYRWADCNTSGDACTSIRGAHSRTYKLGSRDVGHTLRIVVSATNAEGSTEATSAPSATIVPSPPAAPTDAALPSISGRTEEGQTLAASQGSWTGSPTSYAYRWQDCDALGEGCLDAPGGASATYELTASDVGGTVRVVVTATNAGGSTEATSQATGTVLASPPAAPTNTMRPAITGTEVEGDTLTASEGSWTGSPTSYADQWQDCNTSGEACANITDATSSSYKLASSDVGHTVRALVIATNAGGSGEADSALTTTVLEDSPPPPANSALPNVSGKAEEGKTLKASEGSWTGGPTSYGYVWEDCNSAGEACTSISGATSSSYKLTSTDVGHKLRVQVTAANAGGSAKATSQATGAVVAAPPTNTAPPSVSGTAEEGKTLKASEGAWTGRPTSYAYRWEDCNSAGEACTSISGATSSSYKLTSTDVGHELRVHVTATNADGSGEATSAASAKVVENSPSSPPTNTALPTISGTAQEGKTLKASEGSWTGSPTSYAYVWEDCNSAGEACTIISGASSSSYKLTSSDVGHRLRVVVTATNAGGSTKASSEATATVQAGTRRRRPRIRRRRRSHRRGRRRQDADRQFRLLDGQPDLIPLSVEGICRGNRGL